MKFQPSSLSTGRLAGSPRATADLLRSLDDRERSALREAAARALRNTRQFLRDGQTVISALIGTQSFVEWQHYPERDARSRNGGLFYYHAHAASQRATGEHGHFHLFAPNPRKDCAAGQPFTHLIALSVDDRGMPLRVFTTNQWVTAECWEPAPAVSRLAAGTHFDRIRPVAIGRWLQSMLDLFRPQIERVVQLRDARIRALHAAGRGNLLADRRTHILSQCPINISTQVLALEQLGG